MIRAGLGISTLLDPAAAVDEACRQARARLGDGQLALGLVAASAAHGRGLSDLPARASRALGHPVVGASVEGIVAPRIEVSSNPAVMVLAVSGVDARTFAVRDAGGDAVRAADEVAARVGADPGADDLVVVLADALDLNAARLASELSRELAPATVLGTGAAPLPRGHCLLWHDRSVWSGGLAGFVLRGVRGRLAIVDATHPVTPPLRVTRARGNWVLGLEGRPALEVYLEAAGAAGGAPLDEATPPLLVSLKGPSRAAPRVRNVVGFDRSRDAFSVPEAVASGDRLSLVRLDPAVARRGFEERLADLRDPPPALGLYLNCRARGASLFGEAGVEATHLANAFSDCPIAGLVGPFQLAPSQPGEEAVVLTYAGALALIDDLC